MPKNKIIDIDAEFEGVEFDEQAINRATGAKRGAELRKLIWEKDFERKKIFSERRKKINKELFGGYKWIVCSPGNDMLAFYDQQNELLGKDNRAYSAIPPSVVYHYRFEHEYPAELFDKSKNYGQWSYLRDRLSNFHKTNDPTYWAQVFKTRYSWLTNQPHEEWAFNSREEVILFLEKKFPAQKAFSINLSIHESITKNGNRKTTDMFWRGILKGWSIHIVDNETYEKQK